MADSDPSSTDYNFYPMPCVNFMRPEQIKRIEETLAAIGEYGEVHLVVEKGRLRFIRTECSLDVNKYVPGYWVDS
jgi:hypothetical protein